MKSIGEVLQKSREKRNLQIRDVAELTFIKAEYLEALEKNEFHSLPTPAAAQGFLQTYARFLGLDTNHALAILRRDFEIYKDTYVPVLSVSHPDTEQKRFKTLTKGVSIILVILSIIAAYGYWSYVRITKAPEMTIISPENGDTVTSPVVVRGITISDANVEIEGEPVGITQDGEFAGEVELPPGDHTISITAKNRKGNETVSEIKVKVDK